MKRTAKLCYWPDEETGVQVLKWDSDCDSVRILANRHAIDVPYGLLRQFVDDVEKRREERT